MFFCDKLLKNNSYWPSQSTAFLPSRQQVFSLSPRQLMERWSDLSSKTPAFELGYMWFGLSSAWQSEMPQRVRHVFSTVWCSQHSSLLVRTRTSWQFEGCPPYLHLLALGASLCKPLGDLILSWISTSANSLTKQYCFFASVFQSKLLFCALPTISY